MECIEIIYFKAYNSLKGVLNNNMECIEMTDMLAEDWVFVEVE